MEEKLATIKILDNQILDLLETEQDIDHEIDESSKFCEGIYTTLLQIEFSSTLPGAAGAYTKLPKLQLRKFYWKAHKWTVFWDSFKASVDANQSLSLVLKLEYLTLKGLGGHFDPPQVFSG